ncbi:YfaP family protein [Pseudomonas aeruginosa]|uniref:YfaP family protein n=1 Tax=Pseudomonas aeruginosa TaxID=287 RepID=UPI003CC6C069
MRIFGSSAGCLSVLFGLAFGLPALAEPSVDLDGPTAGWRYSGLLEQPDAPRVAYPTPPIDRGGQRGHSLIEGHLRELVGTERAQRLVVNGNPLPLYTDGAGRFVRPYAFGHGSNGVQVGSADGKILKRVQFYEANRSQLPPRVRVVLGWDDPKAELDLHIVTPDGQHAYWAHPRLSNSGGLDPDGVDGPGPEMFTMGAPLHGTYLIYVNYWGNLNNQGYNFQAGSNVQDVITAQVNLVFNENSVDEKHETFVVPLRTIGDLVLVKTFTY